MFHSPFQALQKQTAKASYRHEGDYMNGLRLWSKMTWQHILKAGLAGIFTFFAVNAHAAVSFLGVAAGDATSTSVTFWTRAVDAATPANTALTLDIATDQAFTSGV